MSRPRSTAARAVALAAGAGLLTSTVACLATAPATAAAPAPLGFYVNGLAALPDGAAVAVGNTWDEATDASVPHATLVRDGAVTAIAGLPDSARLSSVAYAGGQVLIGGSDADGAQAWTFDAAAATPSVTPVGVPDEGWSEVSTIAAAGDAVALAGTAYSDTGENVVGWTGTAGAGTRTVLAANGYAVAMAADVDGDAVRSFVVGSDYDAGGGALWISDGDAPVTTVPLDGDPLAVAESDGTVYVADHAQDGSEIVAVDATTGHVDARVSFAGASMVSGLAVAPDGHTLYATAGSAVYAVPVAGLADFDPQDTEDLLAADDSLYQLALAQVDGHLSAYSTMFSDGSEGQSVVHLTAPATPTLTAAVSAGDPTRITVTVPGSWSGDHYGVQVSTGDRTVAAKADCDEDWSAGTSTCSVGPLQRGTTYDVTVSTSNIFGAAVSGTATVRTPGVLAGPSSVSFTGRAAVGATLTANVGTGWPAGTNFTYAWVWSTGRMGGLVGTGRTLTVPASAAGGSLSLRVTGTLGEDFREVSSAAVKVPAAAQPPRTLPSLPVTAKATPKVSGKAKVGRRITAKLGAWPAGTTLHYQWLANGKAIKGATKKGLKLTKKLKGKKVSVRVTGTKPGYAPVTRASKAVKVS